MYIPSLGVSRTFANRGHKVSFCPNPVFAALVERCGFRFLPLGTVEEYRSAVDNPDLWNSRTSLKVLWAGVAKTMRPLFDLMCNEAGDDTVIAGHPWAFGARFFQEKYGVPMITLQVSPSTFLSAKQPPIRKQLRIPLFLPYPVRAGLLWAFERACSTGYAAPTSTTCVRTSDFLPFAGSWVAGGTLRKEFWVCFQIGSLLRKPIGRPVLSLPVSRYLTRQNFVSSILSWRIF
jgi:rhamnosyltransferase subunit B